MTARKNDQDTAIIEGEGTEVIEPGAQTVVEEADQPDELDGLLAELGGDDNAIVTVSKKNSRGGREIVDRYHPRDLDLMAIRDLYGGGEYVLTARRDNRFVKGFPRHVTVAERKTPPGEHGGIGNSAIDRLASMIEANNRNHQESMQKITELVLSQNNSSGSRKELLEEMQLIQALVGGNKNQGMSPDKMLELIQQGMSMGEQLAGKESGMFDVLKTALESFGKPLGEAAMMHMQNTAAGQPGNQVRQIPAGQPGQEAITQQQQPPPQGENKMMKMYVGMLIGKAAADSHPGLWAEVIIDNIPNDQLEGILNQTDAGTYLANIDNRVINYPEWFASLDHELRNLLGVAPLASHVHTETSTEPGGADSPAGEIEGDSTAGENT